MIKKVAVFIIKLNQQHRQTTAYTSRMYKNDIDRKGLIYNVLSQLRQLMTFIMSVMCHDNIVVNIILQMNAMKIIPGSLGMIASTKGLSH